MCLIEMNEEISKLLRGQGWWKKWILHKPLKGNVQWKYRKIRKKQLPVEFLVEGRSFKSD